MRTIVWNTTMNTLETQASESVPLGDLAKSRKSGLSDEWAPAGSNVFTNQILSTESRSPVNLRRLRCAPNGGLMCGWSGDSVYLVDARTLRPSGPPLGHASAVNDMDFSPDGQVLASASEDGTVKIWGTNNGEELQTLRTLRIGGHRVRFSPNGKDLVCTTSDRKSRTSELIIWHTAYPEDVEQDGARVLP